MGLADATAPLRPRPRRILFAVPVRIPQQLPSSDRLLCLLPSFQVLLIRVFDDGVLKREEKLSNEDARMIFGQVSSGPSSTRLLPLYVPLSPAACSTAAMPGPLTTHVTRVRQPTCQPT
jgi:hypothetical protein